MSYQRGNVGNGSGVSATAWRWTQMPVERKPPKPHTWLPYPEWMTDATCAQVDTELFYPEKGGATKPAERVCFGCPVRVACLEYAIANDEVFGVWGGMSASARVRYAHENGDFECADCGQRFSKRGSLTGHRRDRHWPGGTVVRKRAAS